MMVYAYVHRITEFGENEPSVQKSVFKRLRVEHCTCKALYTNSSYSAFIVLFVLIHRKIKIDSRPRDRH